MSKPLILSLLAALLAPLGAQAANLDCRYGLRADISLDGDAVELRSDAGLYRLEGDRLSHDGHDVRLDARQHAAVADYRRGMQTLVPQVSGVALDGAMLGLEAMTMAFAALGDDPDDLRKYERRSARLGEKIHARFNGRELLRDSFGGDDDELDAEISEIAEDFAADISGSITSLVFTALIHPGRIEARADATERLVEQRIEPKADALEVRAKPLCVSFARLDALEPLIGIDAITVHDDDRDDPDEHQHGFAFSF